MFDKVKQLNELRKMRSQAMALQKQLEEIIVTIEKDGYKITLNGAQKILAIEESGETKDKLVNAINEAMKEAQKKAAKKMMEAGGGLSGFFGN